MIRESAAIYELESVVFATSFVWFLLWWWWKTVENDQSHLVTTEKMDNLVDFSRLKCAMWDSEDELAYLLSCS